MLGRYLSLPRAVHILCLGTLVNRAGYFVIPFLTIYLTDYLRLSERFATRTMGMCGAGAIVAALIGGQLTDVLGRKRVMVFSLLAGGLVLIAMSMQSQPLAIVALAFIFTAVGEMYRPAASAMIGDLVEPARRGEAFGLMYVAINLGFTIGPVIGGWLAARSFKLLFWGDALTSGLYALIILVTLKETLRRRTADGAADGGERYVPIREAARHILSDRVFMTFCLATLLAAFVFMQSMTTFPLHLQRLGLGPKEYGRIIAVNGLMIVCGQLPLTLLLNRFHRGRVLALASVLMGVGFALHAVATTPLAFAGCVFVWTLGEMMQAPFLSTIAAELAPPALRGRYMGLLGVCFSLALTCGAPLGGEVLERYGGTALWSGCLGTALLASAMYWSVRRKLSPSEWAEIPGPETIADPALQTPSAKTGR